MISFKKCQLILVPLFLIAIAGFCADSIKEISYKEAANYANQTVIITGNILRVGESKSGGTYFLNFSQEKGGFTTVIFKSVADKMIKSNIDPKSLTGKTVKVTGLVENHPSYGLQIILKDPSQLVIVKSTDTTKTLSSTKSGEATKSAQLKSTPTSTPSSGIIQVADVAKNAGKTGSVEGKVLNVGHSKSGSTYFLNFTEQRGGFTVVIFSSAAESFKKSNIDIDAYANKTVQVTGKIDNHPQYGLQIILEKPEMIKIIK